MMQTEILQIDLLQVVENELRQDEQIIWTGQPIPSHMARRRLGVCGFGLLFGGFAVFWFVGALWTTHQSTQSPGWMTYIFPLFGLPFIAVGLAMIASPLYAARTARKIIYVITNQRALIIACSKWHKVKSFRPEQLQSIERTTRSDGSGDLVFGNDAQSSAPGYQQGNYGAVAVGFIGVRDVRQVEALLSEVAGSKHH
jgi:hypothetical protein